MSRGTLTQASNRLNFYLLSPRICHRTGLHHDLRMLLPLPLAEVTVTPTKPTISYDALLPLPEAAW